MSFYAKSEQEKWVPYVHKRIAENSLSGQAKQFLIYIDISDLDYGEYDRESVEGGEICTWYLDFTYQNKRYEYRRSEVLETGKHLCYGYFLEDEIALFDEILTTELGFEEAIAHEILEIFDDFFSVID